ncbi:flavodoxin [Azoarcus olearius]|uniref:Flavodoxin n=1 Tax=Azoarcus sp. (strain BH72) TaxID=418699 RepID=A1K7U3_AZOSB|nr:flavodoxin [Azoarcus olearius]CAL94898.1 probable flavodoxin [Azoarcus olearius]
MAKIGIFFGSDTGRTRKVAKYIAKKLGEVAADPVNVNKATVEDFLAYDALIIGSPTLGDGQLPGLESGAQNESWAEFLPQLDGADMSGKVVAIYGLGDQDKYANEFCDAIGLLYDAVTTCGATVVGPWPTEGYSFKSSQAVIDGQFCGLALDNDNQAGLTDERVDTWLEQVKPALLGA